MAIWRKDSGAGQRGRKSYNRAPVTTYYRSKNQPGEASPFKRRTPRRDGRKLLLGAADVILLALLLIGLVYSLMLQPKPKVIVNNFDYHSSAEYKAQIEPLFASLKNRNKISFDEAGVVRQIQAKFPEVQAAQIELPFFSQEPTVRLTISPPAFRLQSGAASYIIDYQGVAVAKSQSLPKLKSLLSLTDQTGYHAALGKQILNSAAVGFIATVVAQLQAAKVPISSLSLPPIPQEMDLRTSDSSYYVKFYLGGSADTEAGQMLAARHQFIQKQPKPSQYLDVRVDGKIFYK